MNLAVSYNFFGLFGENAIIIGTNFVVSASRGANNNARVTCALSGLVYSWRLDL